MIQAYPNGDFTDTAMEVVSITPLDSVSKNNTQKYTIKALDNNTLLPLSSAYLMPQIENNNESVVWHGNQTVSENEKKNNFVDSECETSDSSRSILQSADDFQNESTLSQYTRYFAFFLGDICIILYISTAFNYCIIDAKRDTTNGGRKQCICYVYNCYYFCSVYNIHGYQHDTFCMVL